jgi:hypothetical protein
VTGGGEEAATCSVCLGAFESGEKVRLLPVCLHLYHVECIDPWLDAHSTCRHGRQPASAGRFSRHAPYTAFFLDCAVRLLFVFIIDSDF